MAADLLSLTGKTAIIIGAARGLGRTLAEDLLDYGASVVMADVDVAAVQKAAGVLRRQGQYTHQVVNGGVGHNLPQEALQAFAKAVFDVDSF